MYPLAPPSARALNYPAMIRSPLQNIIRVTPKEFAEKIFPTSFKDNHKPPNSFTTRLQHQSRFIPQPPNLELKPIDVRVHQIQRERRAHTMAPISRISGPISTPRGKMFATAAAPVENQPNPYSKIPYEHPDEDHGPIIVKVRYNPQAGGVPSEDAIRKAIGHQIFDRRARKDPIIVNFLQQNPLSNSITTQPSRFFPPTPHPSHRPLPRKIDHLVQIPKQFINQSRVPPAHRTQLTRRKRSPIRTDRDQPKELNRTNHRMATQPQPSAINNQPNRANLAPSSGEFFRPPSVNDIPELSRDNLLNMLNQIPDLQGRRFNIEYAPSNAPEGYPIPLNIDSSNNAYPEPVIVDRLPSNVIQHIKSSNNPALTAALEAAIRQEQPSLNVPPPTVIHHAAQPSQQVQQSRPVSSDESDSSTEVSSSSSSSEETDSEDSQLAQNHPIVGPMPPAFSSHKHHC